MPIEIDKRKLIFKIKEIWFAPEPYDIAGYDLLVFRAVKKKIDKEGFIRSDLATFSIDLSHSVEEIWKKMDEKSCRYSIRRAEREGIVVRHGTEEDYKKFYELTKNFNTQKKLPLPSLRDVGLWQKYGVLFVAEDKGDLIAGNLYFADQNNFRWVVGASKRFEPGINVSGIGWANTLLIWEAIKYAKEKNVKEFDMGGCYVGEDKTNPRYTVMLFKEKFGGALRGDYAYFRYYGLYKMLKETYSRIRYPHG